MPNRTALSLLILSSLAALPAAAAPEKVPTKAARHTIRDARITTFAAGLATSAPVARARQTVVASTRRHGRP